MSPWLVAGLAAAGLVAAGGTAAQAGIAGDTAASQRAWLLQQLRIGEATGRFDLAASALARLRLMAPEDRATLLAAFELQLAQQQMDAATATLQRLRAVAPGSAELSRAEAMWQAFQGNQRAGLQQARMLALGGHAAEALAIYRKLFHDDPPGLQLGVEYWRLRGSEAAGRPLAIDKLAALDRQYPGNTPLLQALSQLLFAAGRDREALATLRRLGDNPGARALAANAEWDYLAGLPATERSVRLLQSYMTHYPDSAHADDARKLCAAQMKLMSDPAWRAGLRAQQLLAAGRNAEAEAAFRAAVEGYPHAPDLLGGLGIALMRQGRHAQAIAYFQRAQRAMPVASHNDKWRDLIASTSYWMQLQKADAALAAGDTAQAGTLYADAHRQRPREINAMLGLADVAQARGDVAGEERRLLDARRIAPDNREVLRRLGQFYLRHAPARLAAFAASLPAAQRAVYENDLKRLQREQWQAQRKQAIAAGDTAGAIRLGERLRAELPGDPWLAYSLAGEWRGEGEGVKGDAVIDDMVAHATDRPAARYAQALYLSGSGRADAALAALARLPSAEWTADMRALDARLRRQQVEQRAWDLHGEGREAEAVALLERQPADPVFQLMLADWARQRGQPALARQYYAKVLAAQPGNVDAQLGDVQAMIDGGDLAAARARMDGPLAGIAPTDEGQRRALAAIWVSLHEDGKALHILRAALAAKQQPDPQGWRDAARLLRRDHPGEALDFYAHAMAEDGLLPASAVTPRDDRALTLASRENPADDWLRRSIRSDVDTFYQAQNPTLTVMQDSDRYNDGTPGLSHLSRDTRIAHLQLSLAGGIGWVRLEQANIDAGRFDTDASGMQYQWFGSCNLPLVLADGSHALASGCNTRLHQRMDSGVGLAAGWSSPDRHWDLDLGHTPSGYAVGNWLGGITYSGDWRQLDWGLTLSRRPMSNSLLSEAGAVDPRSGIVWGGVTATGPTFSLGYDQGGRNGVWSTWAWQRLTGRNVEDNDRVRVMAGWYHKLVLRSDLRVDVGTTVMLWHYARDLSGYTLGQGGYYSPQHYASLSLPASLAWRNGHWSLLVDAALGISCASTTPISAYPLRGPLNRVLAQLDGPYAGATLDTSNLDSAGGASTGTGYHLRVALERRLGDHFVLGASGMLQRSQDFSPNTFQLYLRYTFHPWQGNLPLPVSPLVPYADRR